MRRWVAYGLFPTVLSLAVLGGLALLRSGVPPALAVIVMIAICVVPIALAQRFMPYERSWASEAKTYGLDMVHMLITGIAGELSRAIVLGVLVWATFSAADHVGLGWWPSSWPVLLQLPLALIIGDFGAYWVHRSAHRVPLLWRVHAMHHSSEQLYVLSSGRNHPMNVVLTYTCQIGPLLVLGAGGEVLTLVALFTSMHGMLQHANIDLKHGVFNHIFATADLHRWHHHTDADTSNHNFGSNLVLFDQLFGTRYLPAGEECREVGLPDLHLPHNVLHHLVSPFRLDYYYSNPPS
ncbi:MAG: sterol desaturase/sphingolipid hydroxylase (fatty acid hydroxylase superfamily) [Myxococcota bacterium]|jgi:sterol desaturase/sphingolipid hydroxylase (fatty acid hydroxylase superfamily)